jgi:hypothetical protein
MLYGRGLAKLETGDQTGGEADLMSASSGAKDIGTQFA